MPRYCAWVFIARSKQRKFSDGLLHYQGRLKAEHQTRQHDVPDNKRIMCEADALFLLQAV